MNFPDRHRRFLDSALPILRADERFAGIALAGSAITDSLDDESDLDFVVVVHDEALTLNHDRFSVAEAIGPLLQAFTGEHVGEPRLLICLYGPPILHVDIKFLTIEQFRYRVEDPVVLHDPSGVLAKTIEEHPGTYPRPDPQWLEDRFWTWIHYAAGKLRRGEMMTAYTTIGFLLERVVIPLAMDRAGHRSMGARRFESAALSEADAIRSTCIALGSPSEVRAALHKLTTIYLEVRPESVRPSPAQGPVIDFLLAS